MLPGFVRLRVRANAGGEDRADDHGVGTLVVEGSHLVQVVEALDLRRSETGLLMHLAHRRGGDALARLHPAGHALPQPREDPVGRATDEEDLETVRVRPRVIGAIRRTTRKTQHSTRSGRRLIGPAPGTLREPRAARGA